MDGGERVAIIGGGVVGALAAWFLREEGFAGPVTVIEQDPTYRFASTARSAASIRAQFSCPINVEIALFGATFLRQVRERIGPEAEIGLVENGYLILCSEAAADERRAALSMQRRLGADIELMAPEHLAARYPWLSRQGVSFATFGVSGEGWFDAWTLLQSARTAARGRGVTFVHAKAIGLQLRQGRVTGVALSDGAVIEADWCINAAGPLAGSVAAWIGADLPVEPRKRTVFSFKAPLTAPGMPMLFDLSGAWVRPEGDGFIGGIQPPPAADPPAWGDFEPDHELFEDRFWPILAERVPPFEQLRLTGAWAGHYEMNLLDHNGVVGPHPDIPNFLFANGFSGHGVMQAPGVARGLAELITGGGYRSLDLSPLGFERIAAGRPLVEAAIY